MELGIQNYSLKKFVPVCTNPKETRRLGSRYRVGYDSARVNCNRVDLINISTCSGSPHARISAHEVVRGAETALSQVFGRLVIIWLPHADTITALVALFKVSEYPKTNYGEWTYSILYSNCYSGHVQCSTHPLVVVPWDQTWALRACRVVATELVS